MLELCRTDIGLWMKVGGIHYLDHYVWKLIPICYLPLQLTVGINQINDRINLNL